MSFLTCSMTILAATSLAFGVKVNMQGSLSFGKDVIDTLSHYMRRHNVLPMRRSLTYDKDNDYLYLTVKSSYLCRELAFCEGKFEVFLNEFISLLAQSVSSVIESLITQDPKPNKDTETENHIFESTLKMILRDLKKLLRNTNMRVSQRTASFYWIDLIKRITAIFQEAAISFTADKIDESMVDNTEVKKKLMQKFVLATVTVEDKYTTKLCKDHNICVNSYECTKSFNTLLGGFQDLSPEKVKTFIRYVAEALHDSTFYSHVSEVTANEFQVILNDMGFSDAVPTKEVLLTLQKTVESRLNSLKDKTTFTGAKDAELVNVILSDMDHFYLKEKSEPFHPFLTSFFEWTRLDTKIRDNIRRVMSDIADRIFEAPEELQVKLIHEVRAFLEITVDPEL